MTADYAITIRVALNLMHSGLFTVLRTAIKKLPNMNIYSMLIYSIIHYVTKCLAKVLISDVKFVFFSKIQT